MNPSYLGVCLCIPLVLGNVSCADVARNASLMSMVHSILTSPTTEVTVFRDVSTVLDPKKKAALAVHVQGLMGGGQQSRTSPVTKLAQLPVVQLAPTISVTVCDRGSVEKRVRLQALYYERSATVPATVSLQVFVGGKPRSYVVQGDEAQTFAAAVISLID